MLALCTVALGALAVLHATEPNFRLRFRATGIVAWPLVLSLLVNEPMGSPWLPSLSWMALLWATDVYIIGAAPSARGVLLEPQMVTAVAFGLCGISGARPDSRHIHLILYAILGCVTLVFPTHDLPADDPCTVAFQEVQRLALMYAVGLLISGVCLTRACA